MRLEFHYDLVCPYAYMASTLVEDLATRTGAELVWKPVLLGGILRAVGAPDVPAQTWGPNKARLGALDIYRQAELHGLPYAMNTHHPVRTLDAMRLLLLASPEQLPQLSHALFEAYHVLGLDLADRDVLARFADSFGLDLAGIDRAQVKQELRERTDEAVQRGIFGVPTFWIQGPEHPQGRAWWGTDRLHLVEAALRGVRSREDAPEDLRRDGATRPVMTGHGRARLELFHDFSSPYSYLGASQARRIASEHGAELVLRPMLLGALFRAVGTPLVPLQAMNATKARYQLQDLHDWAAWWGVPFSFPSTFPLRTVAALRVALVEPAVTPVLYQAAWVHDQDIGQDPVLCTVLDAAGFDGAALIAATQRPEVKAALRENTDLAAQIGACGAPTWRVSGEDRAGAALPEIVIWGQDRLDVVSACLQGWRPGSG